MLSRLRSLFGGDYNARQIARYRNKISAIHRARQSFSSLTDIDFPLQTQSFRERFLAGESLDSLLPEAFGLVLEACHRLLGQEIFVKGQKKVWNMVPYDVQLIGGMILHDGMIAEMKTGEGKTLVASLPAYLNALSGERVFVVTVNDYLASRDAEWMGYLYRFLGLRVGCVIKSVPIGARRQQYECDVIYVENAELGFDYLRDNLVTSMEERCLLFKPLSFALVDEADSILIDEARTPLIISEPHKEPTDKYVAYAKIIQTLVPAKGRKKISKGFLGDMMDKAKNEYANDDSVSGDDGDYYIDEKTKSALLTGQGIEKLEKMLGVNNLYIDFGFEEIHHIENALKARACYIRDRDYIVRNGEVLIVDQGTGRTMPGRRFSEGLHQAIEAKEGVKVQHESKTLASITYQNFFKNFKKLAGMTGTALTEAEEFDTIYNIQTLSVPTNKPVIRVDLPDKVYFDQNAKWTKIIVDIDFAHRHGQPILIGTSSIDTSEYISQLLTKQGINHSVLNAKYHEQEASIVQNAGKFGSVVVATNMAGRGTDIQLEEGLNTKIATKYAGWIKKMLGSFASYRQTKSNHDGIDYANDKTHRKYGIACHVYSQIEYDMMLDALTQTLDLTANQRTQLTNPHVGLSMEYMHCLFLIHESKSSLYDPFASFVFVSYEDCNHTPQTIGSKIKKLATDAFRLFHQPLHFGLFVLGTEKHDSRRIDNQLRGRAGRQGDPGVTVFYVALDDSIMRKMGGDKIQTIAKFLLPKKELGIFELTHSQFSNAIARSQKQMEAWHFSIRKHLFDYDSVIDIQRRAIYKKRDTLIVALDSCSDDHMPAFFEETMIAYCDPAVTHCFALSYAQEENTDDLGSVVLANLGLTLPQGLSHTREALNERLNGLVVHQCIQADVHQMRQFLRFVVITTMDKLWIEHIDAMQSLREKVGLMGYAQQDPLVAYKKESFEKYQALMGNIACFVIRALCLQQTVAEDQRRDQTMIDNLRHVAGSIKLEGKTVSQGGVELSSSSVFEFNHEFEVFEEDEKKEPSGQFVQPKSKLRPNDKITVRYQNGTYNYDVKYKKVKADIDSGVCEIVG